ncbi:Mo-dependent nitrogenase C-terminal domain-containing protein [Phormidium sp. LEGE 05292]|uniref:Mo-dependent nitrogenase C-terminal domain-containing protein n=1 Tax=[Phormidium] sp. LEGE 05292 TaxID=767427 RepID=UPI00187DEE5F|nr:Mo-dependent nitrogenase C-terminal domain-containing protein [Phormidium sp. LEGE 05292]MBE9229708.1 Mo-dependent nitrogenase C-terminal domain-containing protein [Phormidium sp. LEGE 05292]
MSTITHDHDHPIPRGRPGFDILFPLRQWVDNLKVSDSRRDREANRKLAHFLCKFIPCCCPFERDVTLLGHTFHIPPLCKLNPLYYEFVSLRLRALCYLADDCGEDVSQYLC